MTPTGQQLASWGGGTAVLALVGIVIYLMQGSTLLAVSQRADKLEASYNRLYHPSRPKDGVFVDDLTRDLNRAQQLQAEQLGLAQSTLVPDLPQAYLSPDLTDNNGVASTDNAQLTNEALSHNVEIPTRPPFPSLAADVNERAVQMAKLHLYRRVIEMCIEAKVAQVVNVKMLPGSQYDPSHSYQVFSCEFVVDGSFAAGQHLIDQLTHSHDGITLSMLSIRGGVDRNRQTLDFIASLITPALHPGRPGRGGA